MSESRTAEQVIYEAAYVLGKAIAGEPLGDLEHQIISDCLDPVLDEVSSFAFINDRDDIPARYFQTIARLVAAYASAKFGNTQIDMQMIMGLEARLRYLAGGDTSREPVKGFYF